ncbi:FUSC family protein [Actinokineospora sp. UTMC 2448]|uniref:FUSC family protein n=1 Tax=Actinokineospora sp. UTMC 2448 TaxID=2268449 RepID=UPI00216439B1|nr:FUSC family protein [Actinokineospora sp. UTMC 2448]UVS76520.1 Inner membrane protein YccS [Actinokineospora sp. UTMC 2448]
MTDLAAPHWLRGLLSQNPVPIPWKRAARAAVGLAGPIAVGLALGHGEIGVLVSIGALCVTFADTDGPYAHRAQRMVAAAVLGAIGYLIGTHVHPAWLVLVAAASAFISASGSTASVAGLQLLVFATVGTGQQADPWLATGCFAAGALFAVLLALAAWPVRGAAVEREAVAEVYEDLAAMLAASGTEQARVARRRLTAALDRAYDALLEARSRLAGRDWSYRRLFVLLTETTPVIEAAVALVNAGRPAPPTVVAYLFDTALRIRVRTPLAEPPDPPEDAGPALRQLHAGLCAVAEFRRSGDDTDRRERERPLGERAREWWDTVALGAVTWSHVARLALCVGLAVVAGEALPLEHSFWVPLTVAIVLKPDFGSVFGRAVLRGLGTAAGVLLGAALLAADPPAWLLVPIVAAVALCLPIGQVRNYGMFSTFVTPLVIVQLDLANAGEWSLVGARLLDTALGCAIVLVFGYLLWPGARKPRVGSDLADALDLLADYLADALGPRPTHRSDLRRSAYRALADLRTTFQQALVEPFHAGRQAAAWWPVIMTMERLTDAVTGAVLAAARVGPAAPADVAALADAVRDAAAAVREQRVTTARDLPAEPPLDRVSAEVRAVRGVLRGPGLAESRDRPD